MAQPTKADTIREHASYLVEQARGRGESHIILNSGDIHDHLGLKQNHSNVGQALEGTKFHKQANVKLVDYYGVDSRRGGDSNFVFEILYSDNVLTETESIEDITAKLSERRSNPGRQRVLYLTSIEDTIAELIERKDELTQDHIANLLRAYAQAKGLSNFELSLVLKLKE